MLDDSNRRRTCGHVDVGMCPHQVLAATLTLSQPGGQIMPTLYWCPHQVLKAKGTRGRVANVVAHYNELLTQ